MQHPAITCIIALQDIAGYCRMELSFTLTKRHLNTLKAFENKILSYYHTLKNLSDDETDALKKYARISNIGASTRIENAQLTDIEINWIDTILTASGKHTAFLENKTLIEDKLSKDRERSIEEVAGCREMYLSVLRDYQNLIPLREVDLRYLHDILLRHYPKAHYYKGQYKTQPNSVIQENKATGEKKVVFQTADAGPITQACMHELIQWYNDIYNTDATTIAIAVEFVFRFLAIHPFQDGNGRLGRGMFLLCLLQSKNEALSYVSQFLAIDRYIEKHKEYYYFTLNRCSGGKFMQNPKDYHIEYFFEFMMKILDESLDGIDAYRYKYDIFMKLSDASLTVLNCFKENPEIRLTTNTIHGYTKLPIRTINFSLTKLQNGRLIQKYGQGPSTKYQLTF